ncbi:hypothetical protein F4859DRAFT_119761 [Xylaria cf. heliscus]|nr:hypothetical protein F4859DRAFT_119761 [Xylaria cf. heliscus]
MSPSPPSTPPSPPNPKHGVFRNERWLCNCNPRLEAVFRTVTKNSKNHGKRFYSCPRFGNGNPCDFFILEDEAKKREWKCLMSNGRTEKRQTTLLECMTPSKGKGRVDGSTALVEVDDPEAIVDEGSTSKSATASTSRMASLPRSPNNRSSTAQGSTSKSSNEAATSRPEDFYDTTSDEDDNDDATSNHTSHSTKNNDPEPSTITATPTTHPTGTKRKRPSQEEDLLDDLSAGSEEELLAATERSCRTASTLGKQRDAFITPSVARTTDMLQNGLPTPSLTKDKSIKKVLFKDELVGESSVSGSNSNSNSGTASSAKRQRRPAEDGTTSTSHATRLFGTDATIEPSSSSPSPPPSTMASSTNLTKEIMDLLKDENITPSVRAEVRRTLEKHANQAKGYECGRDASRRAVKKAEDRAAALKQKVDDLERSRQELRAQLMDLWGKV